MRKLITNDLFALSRIFQKMQLKGDDIKTAVDAGDDGFGVTLIIKMLENIHLAQNEVNDFLGSLSGKTGKEVGEMPLPEFFNLIKEFKEIEGLERFFEQAGLLMK